MTTTICSSCGDHDKIQNPLIDSNKLWVCLKHLYLTWFWPQKVGGLQRWQERQSLKLLYCIDRVHSLERDFQSIMEATGGQALLEEYKQQQQ